MNGAPGQLAVTDFAAAGETETAHLADGVWREVVMQQEVFLISAFQCVNELLVITGAQRGYDQRLGFTTGE